MLTLTRLLLCRTTEVNTKSVREYDSGEVKSHLIKVVMVSVASLFWSTVVLDLKPCVALAVAAATPI